MRKQRSLKGFNINKQMKSNHTTLKGLNKNSVIYTILLILSTINTFSQVKNTETPSSIAEAIYTIPVVFHVIHNYGAENISDIQIHNAINILNRNFKREHPDTGKIVPDFKPIASNCAIEFKLAKKDPDGNCHSGINRIASGLTTLGDHSVKTLIHWPRQKYLNIYITAEAAGLAGHALMPEQADSIPHKDGIVIVHGSVGSIGTANTITSMVLTHEVGHYLGLQHIWGGNNVPDFYYLPVAKQDNCNFDDGVSDTPLTIGWQSCTTSGSSCGTLDNVQNFMDYSYCGIMFTEGQKQRMRDALNSPVSQRNNLWQSTNLAATGVSSPTSLCAADFSYSATEICEGEKITFTDKSFHSVTEREWTFPGGSPSTSSDSIVEVTYSKYGEYDVTLTAKNGADSKMHSKQKLISVLSNIGKSNPYYENFESIESIPDDHWFLNDPENTKSWELDQANGYMGGKCAVLKNFNHAAGGIDVLMSETIDLSTITTATLSFRYAYARKDTTNNETLKVWMSSTCGKNWTSFKTLTSSSLSTRPDISTPFIPQTTTDWTWVDVPIKHFSLFSSSFRFKFSFEGGGGNNIYIDDIQINNYPLGVDESLVDDDVFIFPNPSSKGFIIKADFATNESLAVYLLDISGKHIADIYTGNSTKLKEGIDFPILLANGVYLIEIKSTSRIIRKKLVVKN